MQPELIPESSYLITMRDGTVKQVNPFTGTEVWTVPGRANRPIGGDGAKPKPLPAEGRDRVCAFCAERYLDTPPEKTRMVWDGGGHRTIRDVAADDLDATTAEFRRVPNLFEIVSLEYWRRNFDFEMPAAVRARRDAYLATPTGHAHVNGVLSSRLKAAGWSAERIAALPADERLAMADAFFAGGHELIIARRHYRDDAVTDADLASSGTLTPEEHNQYMRFTVDAVRDLYEGNVYVRYVAVFQNWLKPAGASFDHLHKQLVAIDERSQQMEAEIRLARLNPNIYNDAAVNFAGRHNLLLAENEHAIAFAGFGHRYPTLEVFSKSRRTQPWNHAPDELRAVSDLVHACHAATGAHIPSNEEWYYRPRDVDVPMPWRVFVKWRISNPAGFEGGTRIYVNTIDPSTLRERVVKELSALRDSGAIADMAIGPECNWQYNCLRYARGQ